MTRRTAFSKILRSGWLTIPAVLALSCASVLGLDEMEVGTGTGSGSGATGGTGGSGGTGGDGATGGMGGSGASGGTGAWCEDACAATAELHCANEANCLEYCAEWINGYPWCADVVGPFLECASQQPIEDWHCDGMGNAALNGGVCPAENQPASNCLANGPASGLPDMNTACGAACAAIQDLPCISNNCFDDCIGNTTGAQCPGAWAALTLCYSQLAAEDFDDECYNNVFPLPNNGQCTLQLTVAYLCLNAS